MISQLVANALITWSYLALLSVGFGLIYACGRFFHFAHGAVFTVGGYAAFCLVHTLGVPPLVAFGAALVAAAFVGALLEQCVYRPLRNRGASDLAMLIASMGAYIAIQHSLALAFGEDTKRIDLRSSISSVSVLGARLTGGQAIAIVTAAAALCAVLAILDVTRFGKALRAVANDSDLARVVGIDRARIHLLVGVLGSVLAGLAGVIFALDVKVAPSMGMNPLLLCVVAVIVGGIGSPVGTIGSSFLICLLQQVIVWFLSSEWQDAIVYAILLVLLIVKPEGLARRRVRRWAV